MKAETSKVTYKQPTCAEIDASRADLCSKGILPPKGVEIALYCWSAFFAGSIIGSSFENGWVWGVIIVLSFIVAFHFGKQADYEYDELIKSCAKEKTETSCEEE